MGIRATVHHLPEWLGRHGVKDDHWAELIPVRQRWIVLSQDTDGYASDVPLPDILLDRHISAIYFSRRMSRATAWDKFRTFIGAYACVGDLMDLSPGSRFSIFIDDRRRVQWEVSKYKVSKRLTPRKGFLV